MFDVRFESQSNLNEVIDVTFCNQRREIGFRTNSSKRILGLIITTSQMTLALTEEDWQINP